MKIAGQMALNRKYEEWIGRNYDGEILTIDVDHTDFISYPSSLDDLVLRIGSFKNTEKE